MVKAYCIEKESCAYFKEKNFTEVVSKEIEDKDIDILVLQTNLDINNAVIDTTKDLSDYKKDWFNKTEESSAKLLDIAENALKKNQNIKKVVIVKRLPRYERGSDILQIKSKLSEFGNICFDQTWQKKGCPENIQIVKIDLQSSSSKYLKYLIFGDPSSKSYDGIHMNGEGASRHFTYRAINAIKKAIHPEKSIGCSKNIQELPNPRYSKTYFHILPVHKQFIKTRRKLRWG